MPDAKTMTPEDNIVQRLRSVSASGRTSEQRELALSAADALDAARVEADDANHECAQANIIAKQAIRDIATLTAERDALREQVRGLREALNWCICRVRPMPHEDIGCEGWAGYHSHFAVVRNIAATEDRHAE